MCGASCPISRKLIERKRATRKVCLLKVLSAIGQRSQWSKKACLRKRNDYVKNKYKAYQLPKEFCNGLLLSYFEKFGEVDAVSYSCSNSEYWGPMNYQKQSKFMCYYNCSRLLNKFIVTHCTMFLLREIINRKF